MHQPSIPSYMQSSGISQPEEQLTITFGPSSLHNPEHLQLNQQSPSSHLQCHRPENNLQPQSIQLSENVPTALSEPEQMEQQEQEHSQQKDDGEDGDLQGYKDLTLKLQSALHKIASSKKGLSKVASQSQSFWRRSEQCAERRKKQLEKLRQQNDKLKSKEVKSKPTINKHSEELAEQIGYEPIYSRAEKLMVQKKKKEEANEENKRKEQEEKEALFLEQLNQHMHKTIPTRTYDEYFDQMVKWKQKTNKRIREQVDRQNSRELDGVTFKPELNPRSERLASSQVRGPIDQRGLIKQVKKQEYPFKPRINKRIVK